MPILGYGGTGQLPPAGAYMTIYGTQATIGVAPATTAAIQYVNLQPQITAANYAYGQAQIAGDLAAQAQALAKQMELLEHADELAMIITP